MGNNQSNLFSQDNSLEENKKKITNVASQKELINDEIINNY